MNKIERIKDIDRRKAIIEDLFEDYRQSALAYAEWMEDFRKRTGRMHPFLPVKRETGEAAYSARD